MKLLRWLDDHFEETLLCILLALIACTELIQVAARNLPFVASLTWAEEFCRFCWIWSVFISLPYTIRRGTMLRVSALSDALKPRARRFLNLFADVITAAAMLWLAVSSVGVVKGIRHSGETSPAMRWPMYIIYGVMLFGFFCGFIRSVQQTVKHIQY